LLFLGLTLLAFILIVAPKNALRGVKNALRGVKNAFWGWFGTLERVKNGQVYQVAHLEIEKSINRKINKC
jgi:hypothetical protein